MISARALTKVLLAAAMFAAPQAAQAQWGGQTIGGQYYFPTAGSLYEDRGTAAVGAGTEFTFFGLVTADVSANQVVIAFLCGGTCGFTPAAFNGVRLYDPNGFLADITSASLNAATTMTGFTASRLSYDANNLWVNMESLPGGGAERIVIDVNAVVATPEPASIVLLATGLIGVIGVARRKRNA